ncbi:MAG: hypothetical protein ACP5H3_01680 [Candidatus Aenigmatarchaeota archaeon]
MMDFFRKQIEEKRYLDTVIHILVAITLCFFFSLTFKNYDLSTIITFVFAGTFFPDLDHLLLYKKSRFYNFKSFLRWIVHSNRYRIGFELFHNFPSIILILLLLPILYIKSKLMFIFFSAFLFHLITDLILDKLVLKNIRFWRFGL